MARARAVLAASLLVGMAVAGPVTATGAGDTTVAVGTDATDGIVGGGSAGVGTHATATMDPRIDRDDADVVLRNRTYYIGQRLYRADGIEANETYRLVAPGEGLTDLAFSDGDGELILDTAGLDSDSYALQTSGGEVVERFSLVDQQVQIEFERRRVSNRGPRTGVTLQVTSNRRQYTHLLTVESSGDRVVEPNLSAVLNGRGTPVDRDDDGRNDTIRLAGLFSQEIRIDAEDLAVGTLNVTTTVADTGVTDNATVAVTDDSDFFRFDRDGDGIIGARDVLATVAAFNSGERFGGFFVTLEDVLEVIVVYDNEERRASVGE